MKLRILGCSGAELPGHTPPAFLIDDVLLLDAGTLGSVLGEEEQYRIREILISHSHLDHVLCIPLLADNLVLRGGQRTVTVLGSRETLAALESYLMNGTIWPDFTRIPCPEAPVLRYAEVPPERPFTLGEGRYRVTAFPVAHTVPAFGYRIEAGGSTLLYTGDTGPTELIWRAAGEVSALLVEVSFPDAMQQIALLTGHLTPALLAGELAKLKRIPPRILVTHLKPQFGERIRQELAQLGLPGIEVLENGAVYEL